MKTQNTILCLLVVVTAIAAFGQGSLTPPGAPAPTMKSLQQLSDQLSAMAAQGQEQKFTAFTTANATAAGGLGSSAITIPAGQTVRLQSIAVTTYSDPAATAYLKYLAKEGGSTSRIMVQRIPLVTTGNDPVADTRSGVLQLPMWVGGGGVSDVAVGEVHSLTVRVQSSAGETATSAWVLTGTDLSQ
jgi:hypothetical protein